MVIDCHTHLANPEHLKGEIVAGVHMWRKNEEIKIN